MFSHRSSRRRSTLLVAVSSAALMGGATAPVEAGEPASTVSASRAPKSVVISVDGNANRSAIVLTGGRKELRRIVRRKVDVRWANDGSDGVVRKLGALERELATSRAATGEQLDALQDLRRRSISRKGRGAPASTTFAKLFARGGTALAVVEGRAKAIGRLEKLARRYRVASLVAKKDVNGCFFADSLVLPGDEGSVSTRELFSSEDGCRLAEVVEVGVTAQDAAFAPQGQGREGR